MEGRMKQKIISLLLAAMLICGISIPNMVSYAEEVGQDAIGVEYPAGYIASDLDQNVPTIASSVTNDMLRSSSVPVAYHNDVETLKNTFPTVGDQGNYGTCWAFSTMGIATYDLINKGLANQSKDLSELQLAYFSYNSVVDPLGGTEGDVYRYDNTKASINYLDYGGNYELAVRRLMQWNGATDEAVVPYSQAEIVLQNGLDSSYAYSKDTAHLENAYVISLHNNSDDVKKQIMSHGAVGASYYHHTTNFCMSWSGSAGRYTYYDTDNNGYGHAVMIVGWDDTFSKDNFTGNNVPTEDGAWLVRNSWGEGTEQQDYFWMSYQTYSLADGAWVLDFSGVDNYDYNYQLDGGVLTTNMSPAEYQKVANVFTVHSSSKDEVLKAVSISMTHVANVPYKIEIYTDLTNTSKPTSGTLQTAATTTGTTSYAGVYTIPLATEVKLAAGSNFAVVITAEKNTIDYEQAISRYNPETGDTILQASVASNNRSFYSSNGNAFYGWNAPGLGNFCVKAYTDEATTVTPNPTPTPTPTPEPKPEPTPTPTPTPSPSPIPSYTKTIGEGKYRIQSALNQNKILDVSNSSWDNDANIQLWDDNATAAQDWTIEYLGDGEYRIMSNASGKYLDVANGGMSAGTNVQQFEWNGTDAQRWYIKNQGHGQYAIISKKNGLYLDVSGGSAINGGNVQVFTGNNTNAQRFCFASIRYAKTLNNGTYTIVNSANQNVGLDISSGSTEAGANVWLYDMNDTAAQSFRVNYIGNGQYTISNVKSGKMLDVDNGGTTNGTNIKQWDSNGSNAQKWYIKECGNGSYYLISVCSGLVIDIANGNISAGTNIWTWNLNGTKAQKFQLKQSGLTIADGDYTIGSAANTSMVLDITNAGTWDGANLHLWERNNTPAQEFHIAYQGGGVYTIKSVCSGKVLDTANGDTYSGTNVWQWSYNGTEAQHWFIRETGDGSYSIVSQKSGLCLDVQNGLISSGTNVQIWDGNGTVAQKWRMERR